MVPPPREFQPENPVELHYPDRTVSCRQTLRRDEWNVQNAENPLPAQPVKIQLHDLHESL